VKIDKPTPRKHRLNPDTSIDVIRSKSTLTRLHKVDHQLDTEVQNLKTVRKKVKAVNHSVYL
jgi:hypothetical protein